MLNHEQVLVSLFSPDQILFLAVIGMGNADRADDGAGIILVSRIKTRLRERAFSEAENRAENLVFNLLEQQNITTILFIDAADFGGAPGEIRIFGMDEADRFIPAVSTHKIPITFLMDLIAQHGKIAYLLGIQPASLEFMGEMSPEVRRALDSIGMLLDLP